MPKKKTVSTQVYQITKDSPGRTVPVNVKKQQPSSPARETESNTISLIDCCNTDDDEQDDSKDMGDENRPNMALQTAAPLAKPDPAPAAKSTEPASKNAAAASRTISDQKQPLQQQTAASASVSNTTTGQPPIQKKRTSARNKPPAMLEIPPEQLVDLSMDGLDSPEAVVAAAAALPVTRQRSIPPRATETANTAAHKTTQQEKNKTVITKESGMKSTNSTVSGSSSSSTTLSSVRAKVTSVLGKLSQAVVGLSASKKPSTLSTNATTELPSPPTYSAKLLSNRTKECWVCECKLELPPGEFCWYTKHAHPLLDDPSEDAATRKLLASVCSVCAENIVAHDKDKEENPEEDDDDEDRCCLCLKTEEDHDDIQLFYLCSDCPRQFCNVCVASCHGGGHAGYQVAQALQHSDDDWACPVCKPLDGLFQNMDPSKSVPSRTADQVLEELALVEAELEACREELDQEDAKREEITAEVKAEGGDVEGDVEEEMQLWHDHWMNHDKRLTDTVAQLQDELQDFHGMDDLALVYKNVLGEERALASSAEGQDWVLAAERELRERDEQKKREAKPEEEEVEIPDEEAYKDIEDLVLEENPDNVRGLIPELEGYSRGSKPSEQARQKALELEDKELSELKLKPRPICERDDEQIQRGSEIRLVKSVRRRTAPANRKRSAQPRDNSKPKPKPPPTDASDRPRSVPAIATDLKMAAQEDPPKDANSTTASKVANAKKRAVLQQVRPRNLEGKNSLGLPRGSLGLQKSTLGLHTDSMRTPSDAPLVFRGSTLVLQGSKVAVARALVDKLKSHQKQAVQFMWRNCFADQIFGETPAPVAENIPVPESSKLGGCILAHNMGLGKSLSAIALIQAVMLHGLVQRVLLVVPVNTLENWKNEFEKWVGHMKPTILVHNISDGERRYQQVVIKDKWYEKGGVLLTSSQRLANLFKPSKKETDQKIADPTPALLQQAELVVIDEAHQCLKNNKTQIWEVLQSIPTKRRICLTGTPLQNNLKEYHSMLEYIRPGLLEPMREFELKYIEPILQGLPKDCGPSIHKKSLEQTKILQDKIDPFVHRKDANVLAMELPQMQQVVLHLRPSHTQSNLYRSYKRYQDANESKNFFSEFSALKPIHNHPGCLLIKDQKSEEVTRSEKNADDSYEESEEPAKKWWESITGKITGDVDEGCKIVLLLHILVKAERCGDKVVVFSQCKKTLNFIEKVLEMPDWLTSTSSLSELLKDSPPFGGWKKGRDFLRIDGAVSSYDRGAYVAEFDRNENVRAFLLSSVAGGVGINLVAANRVVLLDTHFNPAISEQAIFRTYRYGQAKPVFVYRLLTQGSMEEKVYARTVTKTGLACQVIDKKNINRFFSAKDLADLCQNLSWVQCERCEKWRVLLGSDSQSDLPENWFCELNSDPKHQSCDDAEHDQLWYEAEMARAVTGPEETTETVLLPPPEEPDSSALSKKEQRELEDNDDILKHLIKINMPGRKTTKMIAKKIFHDILVKSKDQTPQKKAPNSPTKSGTAPASKNKKRTDLQKTSPHRNQPRRVIILDDDDEECSNDCCATEDKTFQSSGVDSKSEDRNISECAAVARQSNKDLERSASRAAAKADDKSCSQPTARASHKTGSQPTAQSEHKTSPQPTAKAEHTTGKVTSTEGGLSKKKSPQSTASQRTEGGNKKKSPHSTTSPSTEGGLHKKKSPQSTASQRTEGSNKKKSPHSTTSPSTEGNHSKKKISERSFRKSNSPAHFHRRETAQALLRSPSFSRKRKNSESPKENRREIATSVARSSPEKKAARNPNGESGDRGKPDDRSSAGSSRSRRSARQFKKPDYFKPREPSTNGEPSGNKRSKASNSTNVEDKRTKRGLGLNIFSAISKRKRESPDETTAPKEHRRPKRQRQEFSREDHV